MFGCSSLKSYERSQTVDWSKYGRIGLLVVRVGNITPGVLAPITLEVDYANRIPKKELSASWLYLKEHIDIYNDDEARLRESFPNYPYIHKSRDSWSKYFRNISTEIYNMVASVLKQKGYQVIDVKKVSSSWDKSISEMKIYGIVDALKQSCDALLVLHYMDVGHYLSDDIVPGFSKLHYTLSMFDTRSKERILRFEQSNVWENFIWALAVDPKIIADPKVAIVKDYGFVKYRPAIEFPIESQIKIIVHRSEYYSGTSRTKNTTVKWRFTDEEILNHVLRYMREGCRFESDNKWKGLEEVIP